MALIEDVDLLLAVRGAASQFGKSDEAKNAPATRTTTAARVLFVNLDRPSSTSTLDM